MTEFVSLISRNDAAAFAFIALAQCTVATALALLIAKRWKHNSAVRQTLLRTAMVLAILGPVTTLLMKRCGLTLISIPMAADEVRLDEPVIARRTSTVEPPLEPIALEASELNLEAIPKNTPPAYVAK